jgi:hypothetical protein
MLQRKFRLTHTFDMKKLAVVLWGLLLCSYLLAQTAQSPQARPTTASSSPEFPGGMGSVPLSVIARGSAIWVKDSPRIQDLELALKTYSSGAEKK